MCERLRDLRQSMQGFATSFDASLVSARTAEEVVDHASAIENMAASVKAAAAARVASTDLWKKAGDRSAAHHLARKTGSSPAQAHAALEAARRLDKLADTSAAVRRGELSPGQAAAIANAATADPTAEAGLLEKAKQSSLSDLRDACAAVKAAADPDLEARRRRIHAERSLRDWTDAEGVWHLTCRDNPEVGAAFRAALDPIRDEIFRRARGEGRHEPQEAYAADALAELARRGAVRGGAGRPDEGHGGGHGRGTDQSDEGPGEACPPEASPAETSPAGTNEPEKPEGNGRRRTNGTATKILVRVDLEALLRGYPCSGETCEIVGFGPVAVSVIRDMIDTGDPFLAAVATRGAEVIGVAHLGRRPSAAQQTALQWLYPQCANEACSALARLEYDHRDDWAATHVTVFDKLDRLCRHDHDLKTRQNWSLVEGRGRRAFVSSDDPRHPRHAAVARRPGTTTAEARPPPGATSANGTTGGSGRPAECRDEPGILTSLRE